MEAQAADAQTSVGLLDSLLDIVTTPSSAVYTKTNEELTLRSPWHNKRKFSAIQGRERHPPRAARFPRLDNTAFIAGADAGSRSDKMNNKSTEHNTTNKNICYTIMTTHAENSVAVWNWDTDLYLYNQMSTLLGAFFDHVSFSVHPAILNGEILRSVLSSEEVSPLSLYIYIGLCIGAWMVGDRGTEKDCWMRCKHQVGELFDEPDYTTATALMFMVSYGASNTLERNHMDYYCALAEVMCERLGALNSEVYTRLICTGFMSSQDRSSAEFRCFYRKVQDAQKLPYYYIMTLTDLRHEEARAAAAASESRPSTLAVPSSIGMLEKMLGDDASASQFGDALRTTSAASEEPRDPVRGVHHSAISSQQATIMYTVRIAHSLQVAKAVLSQEILRALLKRLRVLYGEWTSTDNSNLKPSQSLLTELYFTSVATGVCHELGEREEAREWAKRYLFSSRAPLFLMIPGAFATAITVLDFFFFSSEEYPDQIITEQYRQIVDILRWGLADKVPIMNLVLEPHEVKLRALERVFQEDDEVPFISGENGLLLP